VWIITGTAVIMVVVFAAATGHLVSLQSSSPSTPVRRALSGNGSAMMTGRVCIVTGANAGMGKETALALAKLDATVLMVCRDVQRGQAAVDDVKARSGADRVELVLGDLSSMRSVRQLAEEVRRRYERLHVLINNAGVLQSERTETVDGYETTFAVNYLAPFLLTNLLLPSLKAASPARIVNVVSGTHRMGKLDFDDLQSTRNFRGFRGAYAQSKLALVVFTYELARQLAGTGVTVNAADPLGAKTNTQMPGILKLMRPFFQSAEKGAETTVYVASAPDLDGVTGKYFKKKAESRSSAASYDEATASRLWQVSLELTGLDREASPPTGSV
jgi:NAD(P)-dependent dehydrogenase (short-subunit alcohol dehydrogenase family)